MRATALSKFSEMVRTEEPVLDPSSILDALRAMNEQRRDGLPQHAGRASRSLGSPDTS